MITFNGIHKSFGGQVLFENLSFAINRRERVGLVGRNGHGKTTLFRMILGEVAVDEGHIAIPRRYRIGHLEQHIDFKSSTVLEEACMGLPEERATETWKAEKILSGLGFTDEDMSKSPGIFSGGFQVRLNLAKVLVSEPDMLLLDEPTNYLDVVSIRWLSRFLQAWPSEMVVITHDRAFMDSVTTHTVAIHRKCAKKIEGGTQKLYDQILEEEEIYEKTRANDEKKRKEIERFIERFRAKNTLATRVQSRIKYLEKHEALDKLASIQSLDFSFRSKPFPAKSMMRVENLNFGYKGGPNLIGDLSFDVQSHDRICVIGQNGKGKSTLLKLLADGLKPNGGSITKHPKLESAYFVQTNVDMLHPQNTVLDEILRADGACLPQTARNIAGSMMFEGDAALKKISVLSGGERSRVMLAQILVTPCHLLLLDEPTNHLDMDTCDSLLAAIDAFDGAVIIVTHNEMFLRSLATRFIIFDRGTVSTYERSYQDFLDGVGWQMDDSLVNKSSAQKPAAKLDKKALRQARAAILKERSRALGPLEKKIANLEDEITHLESMCDHVTDKLEEASASGDGNAISKFSKQHGDLTKRVEAAYGTLEHATKDLAVRDADFEARLAELE